MPTKETTVIAFRTPKALASAIRAEAKRRKISVNEMLNLDAKAKYHCGPEVQNSNEDGQNLEDGDIIDMEMDE